MHDYSAGIFTSEDKAQEVLAKVINNPVLHCYNWAWIEELDLDVDVDLIELAKKYKIDS